MMKKRLVVLLLVILILVLLVPTALASGAPAPYEKQEFKEEVKYHMFSAENHVTIYSSTTDSPTPNTTGGTISNNRWNGFRLWGQGSWTFTPNPKAGYEFTGWTTGSGGGYSISGNNLTISKSGGDKNYTATAHFKYVGLPTYDVILDLGNGATFGQGGSTTTTLTGSPGDPFNVPAITEKPGYQFDGWNGSTSFDGNKTLTARYEYWITFAENDDHLSLFGTNPVLTNNHNVTNPPTLSADAGYRADGWDRGLGGFTAPTTVNANPSVEQGTLSVNTTGDGYLLMPWRIEKTYDVGTQVKLNDSVPVADLLSHHMGWKKDNAGSMLAQDVTITIAFGNNSYTAVFGEWLETRVPLVDPHGKLNNDLDGWEQKGTDINLDDAQPEGDPGYELDTWQEFNSGWEDCGPNITIGDQNIFRATFKLSDYLVEYKGNGHDGGTVPSDSSTYNMGDTVNVAALNITKTGYQPNGWKDENGNARAGDGSATFTMPALTPPDKTMELEAQWNPNTYTVTYDVNGGDSGATADSSHTYDATSETLTSNGFTKIGYNFVGWADSANGAVKYTDGQVVQNLTAVNGATITLYAKWEKKTYTVTYDPGTQGALTNGTSATESVKFEEKPTAVPVHTYGTTKVPGINLPFGYKFLGWKKNGAGPNLNRNQVKRQVITENTTFVAQFEYIGNLTLTIDIVTNNQPTADGGSVTSSRGTSIPYPRWTRLTATPNIGYQFTGWSPNVVNRNGRDQIQMKEDKTVVAYFVGNSYTVEYDMNTGSGTQMPSTAHVYGIEKELPENTYSKTGYTFDGWDTQVDGQGTRYQDKDMVKNLTTVDGDTVTLYAQWKQNTYIVTYDINGGDGGATADSAHMYDPAKDEYLTLNGFAKTGYTFDGWAENADGTGTQYADGQKVTNLTSVNKATVTMYAKWKANTYTVTYDINTTVGGSGTTADSSHTYDGVDEKLTVNGFAKEGHTFAGWTTRQGSTVVQYTDEQIVSNLTTVDGATVTLYAVWNINKYDVTYNGNTADSGSVATQSADYGTDVTISANGFTKAGHTFLGWQDSAGNAYAPGATFTIPAADTELFAQWDINTFIVTFYEEDGTTVIGTPQTIDWSTAALFETAPQKTGSAFDQWILTGDNAAENDSLTNVRENIDAVASYVLNGYTVTFVDNNGQVIGTDGVLYGGTAEAPDVPEREGHTFREWDVSLSPITGSITITALYDINQYQVTFVLPDGEVIKTQTVDWDTGATAPEAPELDGFTFVGWDSAFDAVAEDITVTAQYDPIETLAEEAIPETQDDAPTKIEGEDVPLAVGSGFPWWIFYILGGGLLVFFALFFWVKRKKGQTA